MTPYANTPYAQMLAQHLPPECQATFMYEVSRNAKDPTLAFVLTLLLGVVGGESYYFGDYRRGILMTIALFTGIGVFVTVPMWIVRCFTIWNECEYYNDYLAYALASRYAPAAADNVTSMPQPPQNPQGGPTRRPTIGGLPMAYGNR